MSGSTRWLAGVAAVVVVLVAVGLLAAMRGQVTAYPTDSPEHTVQQYVQAVADRDATRAMSFFTAELVARCDSFPREAITSRGRSGVRATLESATRKDNTATVRVTITESYGDAPFGSSESNQPVVFELRQTPDGWRISEPVWPVYCPPKPIR